MSELVTAFNTIKKMKDALYQDLTTVLDNHKTHIGNSLDEADVVGILEKVKFDYLYDRKLEDEL